MKQVYLDNNATTAVASEVVDEMLPVFREFYGNPSSTYSFGSRVRDMLEKARCAVAASINALPEEVIFTSCGTESDNTAILSALEAYPGRRHIITTVVEHPAVLNVCRQMQDKGYAVTYLRVDSNGRLDMKSFEDALRNDTAIVSIMYANNETGVVFPIEEIGRLIEGRNCPGGKILFHTDAVQAVGKVAVDVKKLNVDMLSLSGHKLHAPKGVGALYVRKGTPFYPLLIGGNQEQGRRSGTENTASIVGLGKACELAVRRLNEEAVYLGKLRDRLETAILSTCPGAVVNGRTADRLPNTSSISFEYIDGEAILMLLDSNGIYAASGSACSSGSGKPSHVLEAMSIPTSAIHGSVRFSLSRYNDDADIDRLIDVLPGVIKKLREISPLTGPPKCAH
ncbi:cysteine desulfurase NifS [Candidatus Magnetominusculus dajiuhuensis]|uniref:cysteine desulfurase NifS n=1 Tax=Candidatus Magnetominusculus dajiuhuensis TaxID=3137712 RepID=UPI003B434C25